MLDKRRFESIAFFLPVIGLVLIMPPIALLFDFPARLFGVPVVVAFLFSAWLALIFGAYMLNRHAPEDDPARGKKQPPPGP